jgi:hemerythrin
MAAANKRLSTAVSANYKLKNKHKVSDKKRTAVEWFYDKIKSHFEHDGDLLETLTFTMAIAKKKEREQHRNTWDAAIKAHDDRGHVFVRSSCDFDDYEVS